MEWNSDLGVGGMEIFQGEADVGACHLSDEFLEQVLRWEENTNLMRRRYRRQDLRF